MAKTGLTLDLEISGDTGMFDRVGAALRDTKPLMEAIGVYGMSRGVERLETVLRQDTEAIRTGRLAASLMVGPGGAGGNPDTIWNLSNTQVECGSNLVYAAQVHHGGIIEPRTVKALAIPIPDKLKRAKLWPRDLDPQRELLQFVPSRGGKPNVIGFLFDEENVTGYGPGPLFALASWVEQEPRPFLYFDAADERVIEDELWPAHLGLE